MAHAVFAHPYLLTFVLFAFSWLTLRAGRTMSGLLLPRPVVLCAITVGGAAIWATVTDAWLTIDWEAVGYFLLVGVIAFSSLATLWQVHRALKRRMDDRR